MNTPAKPRRTWNPLNPAFFAALVVLAGSAVALGAVIRSFDLYLTKLPIQPRSGLQFHTLPAEIPGWTQIGGDRVMSKEAAEELGTNNYISRYYIQDPPPEDGDPIVVDVHCAYYTGMIDTVPHVPERCFVGGGWDIAGQSTRVDVPLSFQDERGFPRIVPDPNHAGEGEPVYTMRSPTSRVRVRMPRGIEDLEMLVTRFRDLKGDQQLFAGYFFIANGGVVASADDVRLLAFRLQDDYAYYAKIQFTSSDVSSAEELGEVAGDLLDGLMPEIMRRVPDWVEVQAGRYPPDNPRAPRDNS